MAIDQKVTDRVEITTLPETGMMHVVDVSDTSQSPAGSSYKISKANYQKDLKPKTYQTEAEMLAVFPVPSNGTAAKVANDPDPLKNGDWSVDSGAWVQDSPPFNSLVDNEDIEAQGSGLIIANRDSNVSGKKGFKVIRTGFDWTSIPVSYSDSIWEIREDFDLSAANVTIPENVEIVFKGGIITNYGVITLDKTVINANYKVFDGSGTFAGTLNTSIKPEWFGAIPNDDTVDDQLAINNATDMANDLGGSEIMLSGNYYVDSRRSGVDYIIEVFSNTTITGTGMYTTRVKVGDNVTVDSPVFLTNSATNVEFSNFEIDGNKIRTSSTGTPEDEGIDIKGGGNIRIYNMYIHDMFTDGIDIDKVSTVGNTAIIDGCIIKDCGGIGVHSNYEFTQMSNTIIDNCGHHRFQYGTGQVGYDACGADFKGNEGRITDCTIINNARGINIANHVRSILTNCTIKNNGEENVVVNSILSTNGPLDSVIANCTISNSKYGIYVRGNDRTVNISDNNIIGEGVDSAGIYIEDTVGVLNINNGTLGGYFGVQIANVTGYINVNGANFESTQSAVRIENATSNVTVKNCFDNISTGYSVDLRGPSVSGVKILKNDFNNRIGVRMLYLGGNPSNITVKNNEMTGMTVAGTGHIIKNNTGYITENYGSSTIADASATIVVNHGLNITPNNISLTTSGNELVWYSNITSTQFTINRALTSGNLDVSWEVK